MWGGASRYSPPAVLSTLLLTVQPLALPVVSAPSTDEEGYLATGTMHVDSSTGALVFSISSRDSSSSFTCFWAEVESDTNGSESTRASGAGAGSCLLEATGEGDWMRGWGSSGRRSSSSLYCWRRDDMGGVIGKSRQREGKRETEKDRRVRYKQIMKKILRR